MFQKALAIKPGDRLALKNLGDAFFLQGKLSEAEKYYRQALEISPDYVEAMKNLQAVLKRKRTGQ